MLFTQSGVGQVFMSGIFAMCPMKGTDALINALINVTYVFNIVCLNKPIYYSVSNRIKKIYWFIQTKHIENIPNQLKHHKS